MTRRGGAVPGVSGRAGVGEARRGAVSDSEVKVSFVTAPVFLSGGNTNRCVWSGMMMISGVCRTEGTVCHWHARRHTGGGG
jgi:hypothetical protein